MKVILIAATVASLTVLSGCSGGSTSSLAPTTTTSGFGTVSGSRINVSLGNEANLTVTDATVGTVAYVTGTDPVGGQMEAYAGIATGADTGAAVTTGTAVYNSRYGYQVVDNVVRTSTTIGGTRVIETGPIALTADFNAGTLRGAGSELSVDGTISGTNVGGTVTAFYSGSSNGRINGTLDGNIGSTGVIGAFHGTDPNTVLAGGVVGTP